MAVTRTALRFYGGKAALAEWIIRHFPSHQAYLEPFGGGASVLLRKAPAPLETYNDLDGSVVAFFRCLRDTPEALIRAITLTPFARAEVAAADLAAADLSDVERARRVYVRSWQTIHGMPNSESSGWRCEHTVQDGGGHSEGYPNVRAWADTEPLWSIARRLRRVQIEQQDAFTCLARYDHAGCLIFADPPYVTGTRGARWAKVGYVHEFSDDDHHRLAAVLRGVAGMVVLCGYRSALYDELYDDWHRFERVARRQSRAVATECLWLSPRAAQVHRQTPLPLEGVGERRKA